MKRKISLSPIGPTVTAMFRKNMFMKNRKITFFILTALAAAGILFYLLWTNGGFLPRLITWNHAVFSDCSGKYEITLKRRSVSVYSDGTLLWTSPKEIKVQDALSLDIDNDNEEELILLCWKKGHYENYKPFWVKTDERTWSQHLFVYEYGSDEIRPKWMSSYLGQDVADIAAAGSEKTYYRLLFTDTAGNISSWHWDTWGFTKEDTDVSFVVFGDNLIHEPIYRYGLNQDASFDFLFENMKDTIAASDIAIINQETPFTDDPAKYSDYPKFGTPIEVGRSIVNAGFDIVTCATNHALDLGVDGIDTTKTFFDDNDILCLGIQTAEEDSYCPYRTMTRNGIRFAFLNYTYGTNGIALPSESPYMVHLLENEEQIKNDILKARENADFVILFAHWGTEYSEEPDAFQQKWTRLFLESKVDVVIGTHPHALQPFEILTDNDGHKMLIYYSLGNYISSQSEKSCIKGGMASFTVSLTPDGYQITECALSPLRITWQKGGKYSTAFCTDEESLPPISIPLPVLPPSLQCH